MRPMRRVRNMIGNNAKDAAAIAQMSKEITSSATEKGVKIASVPTIRRMLKLFEPTTLPSATSV